MDDHRLFGVQSGVGSVSDSLARHQPRALVSSQVSTPQAPQKPRLFPVHPPHVRRCSHVKSAGSEGPLLHRWIRRRQSQLPKPC